MGQLFFPKGIYLYTGSALGPGGIIRRIQRHMKRKKNRFWHIDYLLSSGDVSVKAIVYSPCSNKMECEVNRSLSRSFSIQHKGFGSSDCSSSCRSHLLRFDGKNQDRLFKIVYKSYRRCGLNPVLKVIDQKNSQDSQNV
ncbi:MAG: GIY-YIG nuclease family protein [Thermoproteota archaeon]